MIRYARKGNVKMPQTGLSAVRASDKSLGRSKLQELAIESRGNGGNNLFCNDPFAGQGQALFLCFRDEMHRILLRAESRIRVADVIGNNHIEPLSLPFSRA